MTRWILFSLTVVASIACSQKKETPARSAAATETHAAAAAPATAPTAAQQVHNVACGCSLGQKCSNMIEVGGEYVRLAGDLGLGKMEFCGKKGLKAEVQGEMKDGSFVATSFELVE